MFEIAAIALVRPPFTGKPGHSGTEMTYVAKTEKIDQTIDIYRITAVFANKR
jgi:hypothetical protein